MDSTALRTARIARLQRAGWSVHELRERERRLEQRDREIAEGHRDDRVMCALECRHFDPAKAGSGRCNNYRAALLGTPWLGRDLAGQLQRCPGFAPLDRP